MERRCTPCHYLRRAERRVVDRDQQGEMEELGGDSKTFLVARVQLQLLDTVALDLRSVPFCLTRLRHRRRQRSSSTLCPQLHQYTGRPHPISSTHLDTVNLCLTRVVCAPPEPHRHVPLSFVLCVRDALVGTDLGGGGRSRSTRCGEALEEGGERVDHSLRCGGVGSWCGCCGRGTGSVEWRCGESERVAGLTQVSGTAGFGGEADGGCASWCVGCEAGEGWPEHGWNGRAGRGRRTRRDEIVVVGWDELVSRLNGVRFTSISHVYRTSLLLTYLTQSRSNTSDPTCYELPTRECAFSRVFLSIDCLHIATPRLDHHTTVATDHTYHHRPLPRSTPFQPERLAFF
jgi:hypothetical protein